MKRLPLPIIAILGVPAIAIAESKFEGDLKPFLGEPKFEIQQVFKGSRFPNVAIATDGTVLAVFAQNGVSTRRSEDGGKTWGEAIVIANPGFMGGGVTVDENTGDILAFIEERHPPAPLTVYRSKDHGKTWKAQEGTVINPDSQRHVPSMHMNDHGITLQDLLLAVMVMPDMRIPVFPMTVYIARKRAVKVANLNNDPAASERKGSDQVSFAGKTLCGSKC